MSVNSPDARNMSSNTAILAAIVWLRVIPRNVRLGEAPSHGMPAVTYDAKSRGAEAYLTLAKELLQRSAKLELQSAK